MFDFAFAVRADVAGGLLYVADTFNFQVRTITTSGSHAVATLATLPSLVYDIALNPAARVMYVALDTAVYVVTYAGVSTILAGNTTSTGYADGTGSAARFKGITGIALDTAVGVLYAADTGDHRIRRITTAGGVVTTLAGSGSAGLVDGAGTAAEFYGPWGLALDAASGALYVSEFHNFAIRQVQLPVLAPFTLAAAPLPPSPLAPNHQLTAWRALGVSSNPALLAPPSLDARGVAYSSPLSAANTASLNPAVQALLLGNVTLAPRNATPAAAGNTNTTFSTSAQRGLRSLALATPTVPANSLALPALTNLTLAAPAPTQQLQLAAGSFVGLATLTCINCGDVSGLANFSGFNVGDLFTQSPALPLIIALDASATGISAVYERDFDGMPALRWLSLANNNLTFVSDATFSTAKQPGLATVDQSRTPLITGTGCPPTFYLRVLNLPSVGALYSACTVCSAGAFCAGGARQPVPCGANTFSAIGAAACAPCPAGKYATEAAAECTTCPLAMAAPACIATASWRDNIIVASDGAGSWAAARVYLVPAGASHADVNLTCSPATKLSTITVSCALPFLPPEVATASSVLTQVWVAHAGTGGVPQPLNVSVMLTPPPSVAIATGGGIGLAPQTPGTGRIVLRLPASRLTAADWANGGLAPPPTTVIDALVVWLDGVPCTEPAWETNTTISCATPATDATDVAAVVQLAGGMFNVSGELASLLSTPALSASTVLQLLPPAAATNRAMNVTLTGVALCAGGVPKVAAAAVAGVPCASVACIFGRSDAVLCVGWNASHPALGALRNDLQPAVNVTVQWVSTASRPVTCTACVVLASRPVLSSISPASIAASGAEVVITGTGMTDASQTPPVVLIGGEVCRNVLVVVSSAVVRCITPTLQPTAPGFPVVSVIVVNTAGAASTEVVNITYPATFAVSWVSSPNGTALPGGMLTPAPTLRVLTREAATCTVAMSVSSCATTNALAASRPTGLIVSTPASALAVGASGSSYTATTDLLLDALTVTGASGCTGILVVACSNSAGQQAASTAGLFNLTVALPEWRADWGASSVPHPFTIVPNELPTLTAVFELVNTTGNHFAAATLVSDLSCYALLMPASATPPQVSQLLESVSHKDALSSSTATLACHDQK